MKTKTRSRLALAAAFALSATPALLCAAPEIPDTPPPAQPKAVGEIKKSDLENAKLFDEFQEMQERMDRIFHDAFRAVGNAANWLDDSGFRSSVRLSERDDKYIVRVSLPDRDVSKVDAAVEGNTLKIIAKEEKKEQTAKKEPGGTKALESYTMARYEQLLTLPGKVDASKMNVERLGNTVTITLPKAGPAPATPAKQ